MASSRLPFLLGGIASVIVAIVASYILRESQQSSPQLYCIEPRTKHYITTLNISAPRANCFKVTDGVFSEILKDFPMAESERKEVKWLDGYVLPGIIESHGHMLQYGEMLESVNLYDSKSVVEMRERIKKYSKERKNEGWGTKDKWIRGIGWDQKYFNDIWPTAEELCDDPDLKDLYISLDRVDVHCSLVSTKVLALLPSPIPPPPSGGMVILDPGPGVFCDNAMTSHILPLAPKPNKERKKRWFQNAMAELNKLGITGAGDAGVRPEDIAIMEEVAEAGEMTLRARVMLECEERNTFCPDQVQKLKVFKKGDTGLAGNMLLNGGVKLFADGALGSRGAALLEPYDDDKSTSGVMLIEEDELTNVVKSWHQSGFQVNIHAIGDRANRAAVDAFEATLGKDCDGCNNKTRFRIEHAQIIHPDDQRRIAKMGIIPSIQPTHATSDMAYAHSRLGSTRLSNSAYRMRSLFPSLSKQQSYPGPVLSSDFPVEPASPLHGIYSAITRLSPATGKSPSGEEGWYPEEKLSIEQAILGFTRNAGYGWGLEDKVGAIEVGKWADWIVVDGDVWGMGDGKGLRELVVKETWVGGRLVHKLGEEMEVLRKEAWWEKLANIIAAPQDRSGFGVVDL